MGKKVFWNSILAPILNQIADWFIWLGDIIIMICAAFCCVGILVVCFGIIMMVPSLIGAIIIGVFLCIVWRIIDELF